MLSNMICWHEFPFGLATRICVSYVIMADRQTETSKNIFYITILQFYLYFNRLMPVPTSSRSEPIFNETVYGFRFLEALRHHKNETDLTDPTVQTVKAATFNFGATPKNDANELKRKRMTLRASLEELLVEYLHGLAPNSDDVTNDHSRIKRRANAPQNNQFSVNDRTNENIDTEHINNANAENRVQNKQSAKMQHENIDIDDDSSSTNTTATNSTKSVCSERKRRVTQLDRNEVASAIQDISDHEYNIRRLLNYRYLN